MLLSPNTFQNSYSDTKWIRSKNRTVSRSIGSAAGAPMGLPGMTSNNFMTASKIDTNKLTISASTLSNCAHLDLSLNEGLVKVEVDTLKKWL